MKVYIGKVLIGEIIFEKKNNFYWFKSPLSVFKTIREFESLQEITSAIDDEFNDKEDLIRVTV